MAERGRLVTTDYGKPNTDMKTFSKFYFPLAMSLVLISCGNNHPANPSGSLEATEVDVVSTIPARIARIRADLGDRVTVRDTLVVLDTELLRLQRVQAETNRRALHAQRDVLADQLKQAVSQQRLAEVTLERTQNLLKQGSATQQQLDEAQTRRDVAVTQVSTIKNQIEALKAEEAKLNASLAVYDRQLVDGVLLAPISGTVTLRSAEPGEMASPGSVLLRLADLTALDLRVFLSEADVGKVKIGQSMPVMVDAYKGETFSGIVVWVSPEAEFTPKNAQTREARTQLVYAVKLRVANPDSRLHIGMPVEVKLTES
jgi:HlyD family secretion protein